MPMDGKGDGGVEASPRDGVLDEVLLDIVDSGVFMCDAATAAAAARIGFSPKSSEEAVPADALLLPSGNGELGRKSLRGVAGKE